MFAMLMLLSAVSCGGRSILDEEVSADGGNGGEGSGEGASIPTSSGNTSSGEGAGQNWGAYPNEGAGPSYGGSPPWWEEGGTSSSTSSSSGWGGWGSSSSGWGGWGSSSGWGGSTIDPIDCVSCLNEQCPDAQECLYDAGCVNGIVCALTNCGGTGQIDFQCAIDCFDGDFETALKAFDAVSCATGACGESCNSLLGGLGGLPGMK